MKKNTRLFYRFFFIKIKFLNLMFFGRIMFLRCEKNVTSYRLQNFINKEKFFYLFFWSFSLFHHFLIFFIIIYPFHLTTFFTFIMNINTNIIIYIKTTILIIIIIIIIIMLFLLLFEIFSIF